MIVAGLTGSLAAGKSEVSRILRQSGIAVFDADAAVHELYRDGTAASILPTDFAAAVTGNSVDRARLAKLVVKNPHLLAALEAAIHPLVREREATFVNERRKAGDRLIVLDIPLLFETGRQVEMDATIVVAAPENLRRQRALARPGMTLEKLQSLTSRQLPQEEKKRLATYVIDNGGSLEDLEICVKEVLSKMLALSGKKI